MKKIDAYTIESATLLGYINLLIDAGRIASADTAMGLYIVGKPVPEMGQLEASILQGGHAQRLRIATVNDVLSLADLVQQQRLSLDEGLALLRPVGVRVGSVVRVLARIAADAPEGGDDAPEVVLPADDLSKTKQTETEPTLPPSGGPMYLLTPVSSEDGVSAEVTIRSLLDQGVYVFGDRTTGRKSLNAGDKIAFYESGKGVVASADIASPAEQKKVKFAKDPDKYPWAFKVTNVQYFFDQPVILDASLRSQLDRYKGRDPAAPWSWFVQGTRKVSEHDFKILTRQ